MKKLILLFLVIGVISKWSLVSGYLGLGNSHRKFAASDYASNEWYQGYSGYEDALKASSANNAPIFIYVYTDWCHYCKRFKANLLTNSQVKGALARYVKVKINPEKGDLEKGLSARWRVRGYPAVLVQNGADTKPFYVRQPFTKAGAVWRMATTSEFVAMLDKNGAQDN